MVGAFYNTPGGKISELKQLIQFAETGDSSHRPVVDHTKAIIGKNKRDARFGCRGIIAHGVSNIYRGFQVMLINNILDILCLWVTLGAIALVTHKIVFHPAYFKENLDITALAIAHDKKPVFGGEVAERFVQAGIQVAAFGIQYVQFMPGAYFHQLVSLLRGKIAEQGIKYHVVSQPGYRPYLFYRHQFGYIINFVNTRLPGKCNVGAAIPKGAIKVENDAVELVF